MIQPDADERAVLEERVRATIRQRLDIEAQLSDASALRSAIQRAHRDRDAVTNPALEDLRPQVARDISALREEWSEVDHLVWNVQRMEKLLGNAPAEIRAHRDRFLAAVPRAYAARDQVATTLNASGLSSIIPLTDDEF